MRFVMWLNKGPTDLSTRVQFTDWDEVERFAGRVAAFANGKFRFPAVEVPAI